MSTGSSNPSATAVELTDLQKQIFEKITNKDVGGLKTLLTQLKTPIDFIDENGMTPLQHACYKQCTEAVQCILDQVKYTVQDAIIMPLASLYWYVGPLTHRRRHCYRFDIALLVSHCEVMFRCMLQTHETGVHGLIEWAKQLIEAITIMFDNVCHT